MADETPEQLDDTPNESAATEAEVAEQDEQSLEEVIATLAPLDGAVDFIDWLRERFQVVILSDTFYEFSQPLMRQLGFPTLLCHRLEIGEDGKVLDYKNTAAVLF